MSNLAHRSLGCKLSHRHRGVCFRAELYRCDRVRKLNGEATAGWPFLAMGERTSSRTVCATSEVVRGSHGRCDRAKTRSCVLHHTQPGRWERTTYRPSIEHRVEGEEGSRFADIVQLNQEKGRMLREAELGHERA